MSSLVITSIEEVNRDSAPGNIYKNRPSASGSVVMERVRSAARLVPVSVIDQACLFASRAAVLLAGFLAAVGALNVLFFVI